MVDVKSALEKIESNKELIADLSRNINSEIGAKAQHLLSLPDRLACNLSDIIGYINEVMVGIENCITDMYKCLNDISHAIYKRACDIEYSNEIFRATKNKRTYRELAPMKLTSTQIRMYNPPHPGEFIKEICLKPLKLTIKDGALKLGVSRTTLSKLINGKQGISLDMAVRLSKVFGGGDPEVWLAQQNNYDAWKLKQKSGGR